MPLGELFRYGGGFQRRESRIEIHFGVIVFTCYSRPVSKPQSFHTGAERRPDVSVVVVSYNTVFLLDRMFAAIDAARGNLQVQIIVVDNASRDGSAAYLRTKYPNVELIENSVNVGFGRANNQAVAHAEGRYVLLLNTDAFVAPDTLSMTMEYMEANPRCGVLGVKLVGSDGSLQPSCRYFPTPWNVFLQSTGLMTLSPKTRLVDDMSWDHNSIRKCDWVPGCYYLIRREVIERIGLFDQRYFLYYEEVDLCRRVRQTGWDIIYYPYTQVVHVGGESAKSEGPVEQISQQISALHIESELLYFRKHYGILGVLSSVFLTTLADSIAACKRLTQLRVRDSAKALRHARTVFTLLVKTKMAARSTR